MKNLIKRNNYFNEQSFGALHTFLLRNGRISKLSNLILNISYKYHKYPVTRTLWFHTKSKIKSILRIDIHFSSHRSVKLFNITMLFLLSFNTLIEVKKIVMMNYYLKLFN